MYLRKESQLTGLSLQESFIEHPLLIEVVSLEVKGISFCDMIRKLVAIRVDTTL